MNTQPLLRAAAIAAFALAAACGKDTPARTGGTSAGGDTSSATKTDSATATASPAAPGSTSQGDVRDNAPPQIRGLYINAYAAGSRTRFPQLLKMADETEINAFVVDVKDEKGIRYHTDLPLQHSLEQPGEVTLRDLKALVDTMHAHHIYAMARIVVFKDPILSKARPDWSVKAPGGGLWHDKKGNTWVSPWDPHVWDYNLAIAEQAARAGFDAIQFDYVRFAEPYKSLPPQIHPLAKGDRSDAIAAFLNEAKRRLHPLGVMIQADVFGLVPNDPGDVDIGQQWETVASTADHVNPMMYPSHYLPTHLPGVPKPDLMPYQTIFKSAGMARLRNDRLREVGVTPARVNVWLQAFNATWLGRNHQDYGPQQLREQKQGVYDVGFDDWILWSPGSHYEQVAAGLERETVSRRKPQYAPPADVLSTVNIFDRQGVRTAREKAARQAHGQIGNPQAAQAARQGAPEPNQPPTRTVPGQNAPAEAAPKATGGTR
ncbi:putative glycoside hydrolase [Longimicrobium sp.]|uniref:putative glycoside hydrolase n=1 Tax=Longimicrobium sp. TaxID=2029185 RepID=UPI002C9F2A06|nr:putative glycoside hydrolase [Longimicrobium sp.]HSU14228.1 putative glycoside hydrolase [Longimicrobium sp.]